MVATALDMVERGMDFADALHLGKAMHWAGMASFNRKFMRAAKASDYITVREAWRSSAEAIARGGEGILVGTDHLVDRLIRGQKPVFSLKLPIEPAGEVAQGVVDDVLGIGSHVLPGGAIPFDDDLH